MELDLLQNLMTQRETEIALYQDSTHSNAIQKERR